MRSPSFKRHFIGLVIGSQLMGCNGAGINVMAAASGGNDWAPSAPTMEPVGANHRPDFGPVAARPNFQAPSATSCSRNSRSWQVPGRDEQGSAGNSVGWAAASERPAIAAKAKSDARHDSVLAEVMAPAAPAPSVMEMAKMATPSPIRQALQPANSNPMVTAGVVDDNANFSEYLAFRQRTQVTHRPVDVAERYLLQVRDIAGRSVSDAEVRVQSPNGQAMWARTDAGGQVWIAPGAFDSSRATTYQITVRKPGRFGQTQATAFLQRGQKSAVDVTLDAAAPPRAQLDLVFLIDATGSMGDEIDKLKSTLRTIAHEVSRLPAQPDLCFGLVAYRDKGDEYLIRSHDLTSDLGAFQAVLNQLRADGGGDYPEAMNEALHDTVHKLSWRGNGTTRMVFLLADAPPHLDYGGPQYDDSMQAALGKGIKVFSVGASGLDKQGEFVQRQIAQYTGGKFVFLTYDQAHNPASGPGRETTHDVQNYSVGSLDRLIVRLVREDLAKLGKT